MLLIYGLRGVANRGDSRTEANPRQSLDIVVVLGRRLFNAFYSGVGFNIWTDEDRLGNHHPKSLRLEVF